MPESLSFRWRRSLSRPCPSAFDAVAIADGFGAETDAGTSRSTSAMALGLARQVTEAGGGIK